MEELLERLVIAVEQQNSAFPWDSVISILALIASWVTIFFLLKERSEKNRPYMQISFELVRSTLACIVLRNVGTVPLEVKSLTFNETFTKQLQTKTQERLKKKESTSIVIFPNQKWVISFDTNVFNIINDFEEKTVRIGYEYCKYGKNKSYIEKIAIDFSEYSGFLNYISEVDEFKNSVDNLRKSMENIDKDTILNHFPNIYQRCLEEGYDVTKECIPVVPAQHYFMGGIWVDSDSLTSMEHLYAAGETSCNGVHGANRLASNSLLESLVFAKRAAKKIGANR